MSKGRKPTAQDYRRMQRSLALVTAYDIGVEEGDFTEFLELVNDDDRPMTTIHSLVQFSWLLLEAMEQHGFNKEQVLHEHGLNLAVTAEKMEQ